MATRIRVQQAIEELGYVPDGAAQSLSRRRKDVIGMVCVEREVESQDIENVGLLYYDEVLRGVEARIRDHNLLLLITFIQAEGVGTPDFRRLDSMSGKVDGILIGEGFVASQYIERLAARVPVVVIAGTPGERAADVVAADNFSGSAAIITHLIADHGRRRLFHVDGPPDSPDAIQRRLALEHVLRGHPHCQLIGSTQGIFSVRSGEQAGEELLARHRGALPDAVVCANDQMAIGVLRAFAAAGVRIPEEVAVVGFDDIYPSSLFDPPVYHRAPADADAGRAGLRPRPGAHRRPGPFPHRGAAADRARAAVELRLPDRHRDSPGRRDAEATPGSFGRRPDEWPRLAPGRSQGPPAGPASSEGLGAAMLFILRRLVFYAITAWVALTINFFIPRLMPGNAVEIHHVEVP